MTGEAHVANQLDDVEPASEVQAPNPDQTKFPPPGPPVLVSDSGIGIKRRRKEAQEAWEREYGSGSPRRDS